MLLKDHLKQERSAILKTWFRSILEIYPPNTVDKFERIENRFANPIGHSVSKAIEIIYDELNGEMNPINLINPLDDIIRIRSVQDISPSLAISFAFLLKKAIREILGKEIKTNNYYDELMKFESKIDHLALQAFDIYMNCREKLFEIKLSQKQGLFKPVERLNRRRGTVNPEKNT